MIPKEREKEREREREAKSPDQTTTYPPIYSLTWLLETHTFGSDAQLSSDSQRPPSTHKAESATEPRVSIFSVGGTTTAELLRPKTAPATASAVSVDPAPDARTRGTVVGTAMVRITDTRKLTIQTATDDNHVV